MLVRLFSRRWLPATLLVLAASAVMLRLGIWQFDRLDERRAFNARVVEQQGEPPLVLDPSTLGLDLYSMEYRTAMVTGEYIPEDEIVLRNQVWETEFGSELGVKLLTPLLIAGTDTTILVDRGWIPAADAAPGARAKYEEDGTVTVQGQLRRAETDFSLFRRPDPTLSPNQDRLDAWNNLDLARLGPQIEHALLPVYLQLYPEIEQDDPPFASLPAIDLSEGPHFGYALQWFAFAALLLLGYPFYARRQEAALKP